VWEAREPQWPKSDIRTTHGQQRSAAVEPAGKRGHLLRLLAE